MSSDVKPQVAVVGGSGFLGRRVCRRARQYGWSVLSISKGGRPDLDEPWVQGIEWRATDLCESRPTLEVSPGIAIWTIGRAQLRGDAPWLEVVGQTLNALGADRVVVVNTGRSHTPDLAQRSIEFEASSLVEFKIDLIHGVDCPFSLAIKKHSYLFNISRARTHGVERVAMAVLRAASEDSPPPVIEGPHLARYGDVAMIL